MSATPTPDEAACLGKVDDQWEVCAEQAGDDNDFVVWRYNEGFSEAAIDGLREKGLSVTSPGHDPKEIVMLVKRVVPEG
jgi:hypothetical protein